MEDYDSIEKRILDVSNGEVVRRRPCMRMPFFVCAVGLLLVVLMSERLMIIPDHWLRDVGFYVGWAVVLKGVLMFSRCVPQLYEQSTNQPLVYYGFEFDSNHKDKVMWFYETGDYESMLEYCVESNGGLRLLVVASPDGTMCYTQMSEFIPYSYEPIEDVRIFRNVDSLRNVLGRYRKN